MNTLIKRFFTSNEPNEPYRDVVHDPRMQLVDYLYNLASNSIHLSEFEEKLSNISFDNDPFLADLQLTEFYLYAENYLINIDPRFTGSVKDLRIQTEQQFPQLLNYGAFKLLLEPVDNQKPLMARLYLLYLLKQVQKNNPENKQVNDWVQRFTFRFPEQYRLNIVNRINLFRKLREISIEIYTQFCDELGVNVTEDSFYNSYEEFQRIFKFAESVQAIDDIIPEARPAEEATPIRKLIPLKEPFDEGQTDTLSKVNYRSVLQNMLDGFILVDDKLRIKDANNIGISILGLNQETLSKRKINHFLDQEIVRGLQKDLERVDSSIPSVVLGKRLETVLTNSKGQNEDYEISVTRNFYDSSETYSIILKNISHKKHMMHAIQEAKANAERTAKAKSTFLSNMSHEIRTPLNVILGLSDIIKKAAPEENELLRKNIDGIDFSAKNLLSIVNDILDFSKIEAGKLTLQSIDFNLRKVLETLSDGFAIKAMEKGLKLTSNIDKDIPDMVIGDQYRLNQILNNLIGNAIKFTHEGEINISVELLSIFNDEVKLRFMVCDTGIGISQKDLRRIFDSFYQVDNHEETNLAGTGLGLSITKELIKLQQGEFDINSELGVGTEFAVVLPFKKSKLKSLHDSIKTYVRQDKNLAGLKVLVAEDNKMNQFYIRQLLTNLNVTVDIAENGKEAVEIYNSEASNYDLILMDMHMPVMSGIEAINIIRESKKYSLNKIPIMACSADVFPEARKSAIKAGIDFYLTKPLSEDAIKEVLFWLISDEETQPQFTAEAISAERQEEKTSEQHLDMKLLRETFDNDEEFIASLLEIFIQTTPEDYNSMRHCVDRKYYSRASSIAHKLKSSFMNLGMTVHGHHLQQIESNIIKKDGVEEANRHLQLFSQMYNKALLEVNVQLIELKSK